MGIWIRRSFLRDRWVPKLLGTQTFFVLSFQRKNPRCRRGFLLCVNTSLLFLNVERVGFEEYKCNITYFLMARLPGLSMSELVIVKRFILREPSDDGHRREFFVHTGLRGAAAVLRVQNFCNMEQPHFERKQSALI